MRGRSDRSVQGGDPGERAQPDRAGDRIRLLLLPCRVRPARGGLRNRHDQLQPGDRLDRLRHGRPALLRAADARGRRGGDSAGAVGRRARIVHRAVRRADSAQAGARTGCGGRRDHRDLSRLHRSGGGPEAVRAVAVGPGDPAGAPRPRGVTRCGAGDRGRHRIPGARQAVVRPRRAGDGDRLRPGRAGPLHDRGGRRLAGAPHPGRQVPRERVRARRRRGGGSHGDRRDRRRHGAHRGGGDPLGRQLLRRAAVPGAGAAPGGDSGLHAADWHGAQGGRAPQHPVRHQGRHRLSHRGQPARVAHRPVPVEGDRRAAGEGGGPAHGRPDAGGARAGRRSRRGRRLRQGTPSFRSSGSRGSTPFWAPK